MPVLNERQRQTYFGALNSRLYKRKLHEVIAMTTKQAIFEAIEQLPEQQLEDVLRYVQQLARTEKSASVNPHSNSSDPHSCGHGLSASSLIVPERE